MTAKSGVAGVLQLPLVLVLVLEWCLMLFIPYGFMVRSLFRLVFTHHFEPSIVVWLIVPSHICLTNGYTK
jgi:hypothetical protein